MKKLRGSLTAKIAAVILLTCLALTFAASALAGAALEQFGAYSLGYESARQNALDSMGERYCYMAASQLSAGIEPEDIYANTNFRFDVYDSDGEILYKGYGGEEAAWSGEADIYLDEELVPAATAAPSAGKTGTPQPSAEADERYSDSGKYKVTVKGYFLSDMAEDDGISAADMLLSRLYAARYRLIAFAAAELLLGVILFIFLLCSAGHRDATETVTPNFIDKIPFDLFLALAACAIAGICGIAADFGWPSDFAANAIAGAAALTVGGLTLLLFFMSLATRLKLGGLIKGCIIYRVFRRCWRAIKRFGAWCWGLCRSLPLIKRSAIIIAALLLVEFIYLMSSRYDPGAIATGWLIERLVLVPLLIYALLCMRTIRLGAKEIAGGNEGYVIDTGHMRGELRDHAEDLNNIRDGLTKAVDERMKSERFKTELITNVSHDIKTPLTSIINYVDLLEKEKPENEKMQEYIEVLSRQSARLKKLIDDLIEASKASSGTLNVSLERCELGVLLDQTAGEYGEKLQKAGLELVLTKSETPVTVMADGRHMWRIFDNLLNNVCKYAQPGTRVYLSLEEAGGKAVVTFRNISKTQLNISGDELMERFVRGDSSRNTEGSGLGLSIARSLAQLQKGSLELAIDGDLFKVTLSFPAV